MIFPLLFIICKKKVFIIKILNLLWHKSKTQKFKHQNHLHKITQMAEAISEDV